MDLKTNSAKRVQTERTVARKAEISAGVRMRLVEPVIVRPMSKAFSAAKVLGKASWTLEVRMTALTDRPKMQLFVNGSR
jgi:hypothetical protein